MHGCSRCTHELSQICRVAGCCHLCRRFRLHRADREALCTPKRRGAHVQGDQRLPHGDQRLPHGDRGVCSFYNSNLVRVHEHGFAGRDAGDAVLSSLDDEFLPYLSIRESARASPSTSLVTPWVITPSLFLPTGITISVGRSLLLARARVACVRPSVLRACSVTHSFMRSAGPCLSGLRWLA